MDVDTMREKVAALRAEADAADARADSATPGGLRGYDSAILSGIRRKPNAKLDTARHAAYDRAAAAVLALNRAERDLALAERRAEIEAQLAALPVVTPTALASANWARTSKGWASVKRVNRKTVTLSAYGCDWKVPHAAIMEVR